MPDHGLLLAVVVAELRVEFHQLDQPVPELLLQRRTGDVTAVRGLVHVIARAATGQELCAGARPASAGLMGGEVAVRENLQVVGDRDLQVDRVTGHVSLPQGQQDVDDRGIVPPAMSASTVTGRLGEPVLSVTTPSRADSAR